MVRTKVRTGSGSDRVLLFGTTSGCAEAVCNPQIDPATNKLIGYQFDDVRNTKTDANGQTFIYDSENKQVQVNDAGGTVGQYFYNGDGQRVKKVVPSTGETTIFVYDAASKLVAEYSTQVEPASTAKITYLTNDHLGSPRITTDALGQVISRRDFRPFGEEIPRAGYGNDSVRQKFTGYDRDGETALDFAQARMYGYGYGRFTSPDPLAASANPFRPQSWNRYTYSYNNPLRFTDPTGRIAGDFYDEEGRKIGTDGKADGKNYFVSEKDDREKLRKTSGPYTSPVASAIELPSYNARQEIGIGAVNRSESPTPDDKQGGFHEEGGVVLNGEAIQAKPGAFADVLTADSASIDPTVTQDPAKQESVNQAVANGSLDTTYHVHPSGQKYPPTPLSSTVETKVGGTIQGPREFNQGPSPKDQAFASGVQTKLGYHLVVAPRENKVHFYNAGGSYATMPLKSFVKIR